MLIKLVNFGYLVISLFNSSPFILMMNLLNKQGFLSLDRNFLPPEIAQELFIVLKNKVKWEQKLITLYDKTMPIPRLTAWFGSHSYRYSGIVNTTQPWISELLALKELIEVREKVSFNSCLLNFYRSGKDTVGWHSDSEKELGMNPLIASISLGATRSFQVKHKIESDNKLSLDLNSGSLVIMKDEMQHHWLHRLAPTKKEVAERINITFRTVT